MPKQARQIYALIFHIRKHFEFIMLAFISSFSIKKQEAWFFWMSIFLEKINCIEIFDRYKFESQIIRHIFVNNLDCLRAELRFCLVVCASCVGKKDFLRVWKNRKIKITLEQKGEATKPKTSVQKVTTPILSVAMLGKKIAWATRHPFRTSQC